MTQTEVVDWTLGDWGKYYGKPKCVAAWCCRKAVHVSPAVHARRNLRHMACGFRLRKQVLNVISLEFSGTPLAQHVQSPTVVRELDWIDKAWPVHRRLDHQYPKVSGAMFLFCYCSGCFGFGTASCGFCLVRHSPDAWPASWCPGAILLPHERQRKLHRFSHRLWWHKRVVPRVEGRKTVLLHPANRTQPPGLRGMCVVVVVPCGMCKRARAVLCLTMLLGRHLTRARSLWYAKTTRLWTGVEQLPRASEPVLG